MEQTHTNFAPDFFVVGAAKAGTTAVYHWLRAHPGVFLPAVKEPGYFAYSGRQAAPKEGPYDPEYVRQITVDPRSYASLYEAAGSQLTGDVSPVYLLDENAAARIAAVRPDARIIVILRNPVDRAFSQFLHHVRDSLETCLTLEDALEKENIRMRDGWSWGHGYATHGHYAAQVDRYLAVFPREQILFLEYRDLQIAPGACWQRVCAHLGLEHSQLVQNDRFNATNDLTQVCARPRLARLMRHPGPTQTFLKELIPANFRSSLRRLLDGRGRPVPVLTDDTKRSLAKRYRGERRHLEEQTGLTLSHWLA